MNTIGQEEFEQLKASGKLPSPKGAALAIVRHTQRENASIADLARVVKTDPAFVGRLIKAANSVISVGRRPVVSVHDALIVVGISAVRSLALGFSLLSDYRKGNCRSFDYGRFWSRSLLCAIAMQALTKESGASPGEEMFSVGLLSHVGELALATLFPEEYAQVLDRLAVDHGARLSELELQSFVMTHGDLTVAMLRDWGLPKLYLDTLEHLEEPHDSKLVHGSRQYVLLQSLVLAENIADICLAAKSERRARMQRVYLIGARLALEADGLNATCDRVAQEWLEWGTLLKVEASPLPPFEEMSREHAPAEESAGESMRVLLVGHATDGSDSLRAVLVKEGHEVLEAPSLATAIEAALGQRPQVMLARWPASEKNGLELIKSLRQTETGRGIYILLLTESSNSDGLVEVLQSGIDDCLDDSLSPGVLAAKLRAVQRVVKLQRENDERKIAESSALDFSSRLQVMTRRHAGAHEAESRRLARELHDRVSSSLTAIGLSLGVIARQLPEDSPSRARERLSGCMTLVKETILTVREISYGLHPPVLEYGGLVPALEDYAQKFSAQTGIAVEVAGEDWKSRLPAETETALYRIAQEALTNCAKYARAGRVTISIDGNADRAVFTIADDGVGFDLAKLTTGENTPGLGLLSMRERAAAIGARFKLESAPGLGTRITVEV